jgi:flavin-dependent dehydrogenase
MATWHEPGRDLPVIASPDVVVAGAGSAGVAAAIAAAQRGADTWLVERLGFVGGLATGGLINLLLTLDDGEGNQVVAGICQDFVDRMAAAGHARFPAEQEWGDEDPDRVDHWRRWGLIWGAPPESVRYSVAFDPEAFVDVAYRRLAEAGVRLRLHTLVVAAYLDHGAIDAVVVESKAGRQVLRPRVVIDTTGDADVAVRAGVAHESVQVWPYLWFRMGG